MIVFVEGRKVTIQEPTPITLKKYGLSLNDWKELLARQGYCCPICKRVLEKKTNIDHFHAQGWKRMKDEKKKLFIRGVTCWWCNKSHLAKGINIFKVDNLHTYLHDFEKRRPK